MDRISSTRRPVGPARGYQRWRSLLFMHWPVSEASLRPLVPASMQVDTFEGQAYIGLVPFGMEGVRPRWAPESLAFDFLETNVRTYVHIDGHDPGVYFLSLDAASRIAVQTARAIWGLPYFHSRMFQREERGTVEYGVDRRTPDEPKLRVRYELGEALGPSAPGTFEHFLVERYLLHLERRGRVLTGQVYHTPYPVQRARVLEIRDELLGAAGVEHEGGLPPIVHYASGVDVEVFTLGARQLQPAGATSD